MKETFIVLHEEVSCVGMSEYKVVKEMPDEIHENWVMNELEVEKTEEPKVYVIMDESEHYHHGVLSVHLTKESIENAIQIVKQFDGYNNEMLIDILCQVGNGHQIQTEEDVYF